MKLYIPDIPLIDFDAQAAVQARLDRQIKAGSLGILEPLALRLATITGRSTLSFPRKTTFILGADHGHRFGNRAETRRQLETILSGNGAVNALSRQAGAPIVAVDIGLNQPIDHPNLAQYSSGTGTRNMAVEQALGFPQTQDAMMIGMNLISMEMGNGLDIMVPAELATGSRASAIACLAALTETDVADITDDPETIELVNAALETNQPTAMDVLEVCMTVGGLEIAGMVGLCLASAAGRVPILLDGVSSCTAALLAIHFNPAVRPYIVAGHRDGTKAHDFVLRKLGQRPLLDLGIAHSAGVGASMAFHLIEAAARMVNETALDDDSSDRIALDVS